jgi:hypothetical protein
VVERGLHELPEGYGTGLRDPLPQQGFQGRHGCACPLASRLCGVRMNISTR